MNIYRSSLFLIPFVLNLRLLIRNIFGEKIDNIIRPIFVSRFAHMHPLPILIGMVGGVFYFGILGFILGPLIIAYAFIMIEIYRGKQITGIFIHENLK